MKYLDEAGLATLWSNIKTYVASQSGGSSSFATALITTPAEGAYGTNADGYTALMNAWTNKQPAAVYTASGAYYPITNITTVSGSTKLIVEFWIDSVSNNGNPVSLPTLCKITWQSTGEYTMTCQQCLTHEYLYNGGVATDFTSSDAPAVAPLPTKCNWVYNITTTSVTMLVSFDAAKAYGIPFEMSVIVRNTTTSTITVVCSEDSVDSKSSWTVAAGGFLEMNAKYINCSSSNVNGDMQLLLRVL